MRKALRSLPPALASFFIGSLLITASAAAQAPAVIVKVHQASGIISPYFQLAGRPGAGATAGTLELVNPTASPIKVTLDPVDGMTTSTLGSAYADTRAGAHGSTRWVRLSERFVSIPAHRRTFVRVGVAVPTTGAPGDYLAGVAVEVLGQDEATKATKGMQIGEITRYAIGLEVKLPGARHPALHFTGAALTREPSGLAFLLDASNSGNVILKNVHGWVRVITGRRQVAAFPIAAGTFVSGTSIQYPIVARREDPTPGTEYRVEAALVYDGGAARLDKTLQFSHAAAVTQQNYGGRKLPSAPAGRFLGIGVLLVSIVGGFIAVPLMRRRRRRPLSRAAGIALLDEYVVGRRPLSVVLVSAAGLTVERLALALRPSMRREWSVCNLGAEGLLIICPTTTRPGAVALRDELYARFSTLREVADSPVEVTISTAVSATTAQKLLDRLERNRRRSTLGRPARPTVAQTEGQAVAVLEA